MTSFYPVVPQSYDALMDSPPPSLKLLRVARPGTPHECLWLVVCGSEDRRPLAVSRYPDHPATIELTRFGNNEPNVVLQALADHWGCPIVSEYEHERFDPVQAVTP